MKIISHSLVFAICSIFFLSSCSTITIQGQSLDEKEISKIQDQKLSKSQIEELIGTPVISDDIASPNSWYYIERIMSKKAFFASKVIEQKLVKIEFDQNDFVKDVLVLDNANRDGITVSREYTETKGTDMNNFQKFFKNVGRFNKHKKDKRAKGSRR